MRPASLPWTHFGDHVENLVYVRATARREADDAPEHPVFVIASNATGNRADIFFSKPPAGRAAPVGVRQG